MFSQYTHYFESLYHYLNIVIVPNTYFYNYALLSHILKRHANSASKYLFFIVLGQVSPIKSLDMLMTNIDFVYNVMLNQLTMTQTVKYITNTKLMYIIGI